MFPTNSATGYLQFAIFVLRHGAIKKRRSTLEWKNRLSGLRAPLRQGGSRFHLPEFCFYAHTKNEEHILHTPREVTIVPDSSQCPLVSVVLPFGTDPSLTATGLCSVFMQNFTDWELLVVVDGSVNESILTNHTEQGSDYRVIRAQTNNMLPCARNVALREARGNFITYLDPGDEYYLGYLSLVAQFHEKADILVFGYDVLQKDVQGSDQVDGFDSLTMKDMLLSKNVIPPLGIAHRRGLFEHVGGFNELPNADGDWDFWKRFARAGAEFAFLPYKSGRRHRHALCASRTW